MSTTEQKQEAVIPLTDAPTSSEKIEFTPSDRTDLCEAANTFIRCMRDKYDTREGDEWKQQRMTSHEQETYHAALELLRSQFAAGPRMPEFHSPERKDEACRKKSI